MRTAVGVTTMRHKRTAGGRPAARISILLQHHLWKAAAAVICVLLIFFLVQIDRKLRPAAEKACLYECRSLTAQIAAESTAAAIRTVSAMELPLTSVSYDENRNITGIHANTEAVNTVQTVLLEEINAALERAEDAEMTVRIGTLTGSYLLADRGAALPLRYAPRGTAEVVLESGFSSAGINQTIHTLSAVITIHAGCSVPLYSADTTQTYTYLLAETVIVGDVPAVQWNTGHSPAAS